MTELAAPPQEKTITGEELAQMTGVGLCELIDGRIVPMSPTGNEHGNVEVNFSEVLKGFVRQSRTGKIRAGEIGLYTQRNPDRVRAADVLFISNERYAQLKSKSYLDIAPELIVEILSPHDAMAETTQKLREYFAIGVRLVWVADPEARSVYAYRSLTDVREFKEGDTLTGDDVLPGFSVPVAQLFED
ncbi:MAG: Uma2 family endonuclease [Anaerolineales bacterium]